MKRAYFIILALIGVAFQSFLGFGDCMSDFEKTVNGVTKKTVLSFQKEVPYLSFIGMGGSLSPEGVIIHKSLTFQTQKIINKDEGVKLIAKIVEDYMNNFYAENKLKTYLEKHPLTYKNLKIIIFVHDEKDNRVYHPGLHMLNLSEGILSYETVSPSERFYLQTESYIQEPFEDAAKRVGVWDTMRH